MNEMTPHRRIVTGHTPQGKAIFERDEEIVGYLAPSKDAQLTVLWSTDAFPNDNTDPRDGKDLPTVRIGDPSKLRPGEWVIAIGSPGSCARVGTASAATATSRSSRRRSRSSPTSPPGRRDANVSL